MTFNKKWGEKEVNSLDVTWDCEKQRLLIHYLNIKCFWTFMARQRVAKLSRLTYTCNNCLRLTEDGKT